MVTAFAFVLAGGLSADSTGHGVAARAAPVALNTPTTDTAAADFFTEWERRASRIQAKQPHWITPLVTVTPRLEQELRYDVAIRRQPNGASFTNIGVGKGLELIPFDPIELIVGAPPYMERQHSKEPNGWGDWPLLLKARLLSANEQNGNYILTAFLGASVPT